MKLICKTALAMAFSASLLSMGNAEPVRLPFDPIDEGLTDESFVDFRSKLLFAAQKCDPVELVKYVESDFGIGFDGYNITALFSDQSLHDQSLSFCNDLIWVLNNGGAWVDGRFIAPHYHTQDPDPEKLEAMMIDWESWMWSAYAVVGKDVVIREDADPNSKNIGLLSYEFVESRSEAEARNGYIAIKTYDGLEGYVNEGYLHGFLDWRAHIHKDDSGQWKLLYFVAGD